MACTAMITSCFSFNMNIGKTVSCKGPVVVKEIEGLTDFEEIVISGAANLYLQQADNYSVSVEANEEVFDHIDYKVDGNVLNLGAIDNVNIRAKKYDITVTLPEITKIVVYGAADVKNLSSYESNKDVTIVINGAGDIDFKEIKVPSISVNVNGASDIKLASIDVENLSVQVNGAGDAELSGSAKNCNFSVNGAGDIDATGLEIEHIYTHKAGMASIRLKD